MAGRERDPDDAARAGTERAPELPPAATATSNTLEEGGLVAWMQVAASFALYFNHLGLLNTFGVFQTYYETELLSDSSPSAISWIGSVQVFCLMFIGVFVGPMYDAGYCRALIVAGTLLVSSGFMFTSISTQYWQVLLAQGICIGLGTCCLSIPSIAIVPMYFAKRRARAMALATVGSSLGATLYPVTFNGLLDSVGFGWAMRVMGFISLVMCLFALAVIRPRTRPQKPGAPQRWVERISPRRLIDPTALKERTYIICCIAIFFSNLCFFEPIFYLESYALVHGMSGMALASYLLVILNACSIPGRILPSFIADKIGCLNTYIAISALSAVSIFYWISVTNVAGNIAFAVLYGFFSGGVVSLAPVVMTTITRDLSRLGTRLGMLAVLKGIGSLVGPPASGAILGTTGSYLGLQLFAAITMSLTAIFSLLLCGKIGRTGR
ncbi:MFS general substrate transporter [Thozetella sp. PMI_491]|nr:MFS general substrate transporter [Thozetella sp. PMI_491]